MDSYIKRCGKTKAAEHCFNEVFRRLYVVEKNNVFIRRKHYGEKPH
jgi:hypothetical protein